MAFDDTQLKAISTLMDAYIESIRPPENIRHEIDICWQFDKQSIVIYESRPRVQDPSLVVHNEIAKATWVQRAKEWHIYWLRGNGKWQRYEPLETVGNLQRFLIEVEKDPLSCFWG